jgi:hypothetical protein
VSTPPDILERRIDELRAAVRRAVAAGDRARSRQLRADLREAERAWDEAVARIERDSALTAPLSDGSPAAAAAGAAAAAPGSSVAPAGPDAGAGAPAAAPASSVAPAGPDAAPRGSSALQADPPAGAGAAAAAPGLSALPVGPPPAAAGAGSSVATADTTAAQRGQLLPIREQVHQALTLIGVPAAPRLIVAVQDAFFSGPLVAARLTSLRRDEERSFRSAPYARAYYLCAALTADLLAPARGLLAVSTWPLEQRVIGPLSPRVDYLSAAIAVAEGVRRIPGPSGDAHRLLWRFAVNIPGAQPGGGNADPALVAQAALAELEVHREADAAHRQAAAARARDQLDDAGQLFGGRLHLAARSYQGA